MMNREDWHLTAKLLVVVFIAVLSWATLNGIAQEAASAYVEAAQVMAGK